MGGKGGSQSIEYVIGHRYWVGVHLIACHGPVSNIYQINVANQIAWVGNITENTQIYIDKPNLFAGPAQSDEGADETVVKDPTAPKNAFAISHAKNEDESFAAKTEGGVVGNVDIEFGKMNQGKNSYLASQLGAKFISAFRGVVGFVLRQVYVGNTEYVKSWSFLIGNFELSDDWYSEKKKIRSQEVTAVESYIREGKAGVLSVYIEPQEAIDAGAQWRLRSVETERVRVEGGRTGYYHDTREVVGDPVCDWIDSGDDYAFEEPDSFYLEFKSIDDWYKPFTQKVWLTRGYFETTGKYRTEPIEEEEDDEYTPPTHER
ncbi:MAG: hypothetical protein ACOCQD_03520 [archaeon]